MDRRALGTSHYHFFPPWHIEKVPATAVLFSHTRMGKQLPPKPHVVGQIKWLHRPNPAHRLSTCGLPKISFFEECAIYNEVCVSLSQELCFCSLCMPLSLSHVHTAMSNNTSFLTFAFSTPV